MSARSPQQREARAFTAPEQLNHRRYEALRAFFVDGLSHAQAGQRFGYTRWGMVNLVREYRAGKVELFAPPRKPGPTPGSSPAKALLFVWTVLAVAYVVYAWRVRRR